MFVKDGRFGLVEVVLASLPDWALPGQVGELIMGSSGPLWIDRSTLDSFGICITDAVLTRRVVVPGRG